MATEFTPLHALAGGALIGLASVLLMLVTGRIAGISGLVARLVAPTATSKPFEAAAFLIALVASPLVWTALTGAGLNQYVTSSQSQVLVAGLLVGAGAALGGGCTSGHGVCGLARLSPRSAIAVAVFMTSAAITVYVIRHVAGGWPWP